MDQILTKQRIAVSTDGPVVVLEIAGATAKLTYESALAIAQMLRLFGKVSSRVAGVREHWTASAQDDQTRFVDGKPKAVGNVSSLDLRRLKQRKVGKSIRVGLDGSGVRIYLGTNFSVTFDHTVALRLSEWLRIRGREAKRFAGDQSKAWRTLGLLTTAEQNQKLGI